jgi:hypothetical protein
MINNVPIIVKGVRKRAPQILAPEARTAVSRAFFSIKNQMIGEFLSHPITMEIQGGVDSGNISGTLGGRGNLFSFIGFEAGSDPIQPILDVLYSTDLRFTKVTQNGVESIVVMPTADEIFAVTPMPWAEGRSWAHGIERGISGLGWFIRQEGLGRSGGGIQSSQQLLGNVKFRNVQYISALINKYAQLFRSL